MPTGRLRLALISMHTSPLADAGAGDAGGMNVMLRHSADALAAAGHQVDLFTRRSDPDPPDTQPLPSGAVVHQLRAGPAAPVGKREQEDLIAPFAATLATRWDGWDVVHSHHWFSGMAAQPLAAAHGRPHIQTFHSIAADHGRPLSEGEPPEGPGRVDGERHLAQVSDAVIAVSRAEGTTAIQRLGASPDRVHVVPPGVDLNLFRPLPGRAGADAHRDSVRRDSDRRDSNQRSSRDSGDGARQFGDRPAALVLAARLEPLKGVDLAIRALALVPEDLRPTLHVLGTPSSAYAGYEQELRGLADRLGVGRWLQFSGAVSRTVLARSFATARAVLVPSHSETFGLTALEAAACGVPVITSGAGGLSEAVQDGVTGLVIPARDPRQWADAITSLLLDPERAAALGAAGRKLAGTRTWQATAAGWLAVYRQVRTRAHT